MPAQIHISFVNIHVNTTWLNVNSISLKSEQKMFRKYYIAMQTCFAND